MNYELVDVLSSWMILPCQKMWREVYHSIRHLDYQRKIVKKIIIWRLLLTLLLLYFFFFGGGGVFYHFILIPLSFPLENREKVEMDKTQGTVTSISIIHQRHVPLVENTLNKHFMNSIMAHLACAGAEQGRQYHNASGQGWGQIAVQAIRLRTLAYALRNG